ncbi:MAG TPA: putative quinol monooxygenase [Candidatus Angelobacter sp.]|nr:putative quinol monooxygenase [Candidatus Angelobacter sp.]
MIVLKVDMLVKAGAEARCKDYLHALQENSRREPGCLMYLTHQSTENPRKFLIYEQYKDQAAMDAHRESAHFKQYVRGGLDTIVESRTRDFFQVLE